MRKARWLADWQNPSSKPVIFHCISQVAEIHARFTCRMHDPSQFMKELLIRFTRWFNRVHPRKGTLWEERFKSVIVECGVAARTIAAYIDLNPLRAGMVKDSADYRWTVNTRAELIEYDPALAALCREVFGDTEVKYTKVTTRLTGHMAGYESRHRPHLRLARAAACDQGRHPRQRRHPQVTATSKAAARRHGPPFSTCESFCLSTLCLQT